MATSTATKQQLALTGGEPVSAQPLSAPLWAPVNEATAQQLAELYLSRNWSFNGMHEQQFSRDFATYHGAKHGILVVERARRTYRNDRRYPG